MPASTPTACGSGASSSAPPAPRSPGSIYIAYFRSFNPSAGQLRELDVIAAVIIGGGLDLRRLRLDRRRAGRRRGDHAAARPAVAADHPRRRHLASIMPQHWVNVFIGLILIVAVLGRHLAPPGGPAARLHPRPPPRRPDGRRHDHDQRPWSTCAASRRPSAPSAPWPTSNLRLEPGEILGLVGDNSAGKSTLMKIMTGAYQRDEGEVLVEGQPTHFKSPHESRERRHRDDLPGLRAVREHGRRRQHLPRPLADARAGSSTARRMEEEAWGVLRRLKVDVNLVRQRSRACPAAASSRWRSPAPSASTPRSLILDEPTANLSVMATERLLETMARAQAPGRRPDHHQPPPQRHLRRRRPRHGPQARPQRRRALDQADHRERGARHDRARRRGGRDGLASFHQSRW